MRVGALRSGSSGNLYFVEQDRERLLVDCGVNGKTAAGALAESGIPTDQLTSLAGILLTHEHSDHLAGVGVLMRRFHLPLYTNRETFEKASSSLGRIDLNLVHFLTPGLPAEIGSFQVTPFSISHDAANPVGYTVAVEDKKVAFCTDLGQVTETVKTAVAKSQVVFLEANYDPTLLEEGAYPYYLKTRIRGQKGHLSNQMAGELAVYLVEQGTKHVILSHLSRENNFPILALETVEKSLTQRGAVSQLDYQLEVADRFRISPVHVL